MNLIDELNDRAEFIMHSKGGDAYVASLLRRAAAALVEAERNIIILVDEEGNEIAKLDEEISNFIFNTAITEYIHKAIRERIEKDDG